MTLASQASNPQRGSLAYRLALIALASLLVFGAMRLEILVDDAFICFRHVSNARDGHGLVWNPPPFLPVEGSTSLLWPLVLWATWAWFGIEPPQAANALSIGCGVLSLMVCAAALSRLRSPDGHPLPAWLRILALACIVGNRTFLQWQTSGLETGLFILSVTGWGVFGCCRGSVRRTGWWFGWSLLAVAAAWTRPDGLLFVAATVGVAVLSVARGSASLRTALLGLSPLSLVVGHLVWRRCFYGDWLPNTYYAKVGAAWPSAGCRHFACFALENAVWLWGPLALAWCGAMLRRLASIRSWLDSNLPAVAVAVALAGHVAYYVVQVGGDHFEYRVFSHLIPLGVLAGTAMGVQLWRSWAATAVALLALGAAASVSWYQLAVTEFRTPPRYDPMAPHMPSLLRPVARWYDRQRMWMQMHMVGIRFLHGIPFEASAQLFPERKRRANASDDDVPVLGARAVGWVGWVLPDVAVIDELGLNDWVIARGAAHCAGDALFPKVARDRFRELADGDRDGCASHGELASACTTVLGVTADDATGFADALLVLLAEEQEHQLTQVELAAIEPFFAELRLMAHSRAAPPDYLAAFDPNVTIAGRDVAIRVRSKPLRAADVRAIEAAWRERVRSPR